MPAKKTSNRCWKELGDPASIAAQIRGEQNAAGNANTAPSGISLGARIPLAFVHVMISIPILGSLILTISCLVAAGGCMLIAGILGCILLLLFGFAAHVATGVMWIGGSLIIAAVGVLLGLSCIYLTKWLCQVLIRSTNYVFGREAK